MIKYISHKLPLFVKVFLNFILFWALVLAMLYVMGNSILDYLYTHHKLSLSLNDLVSLVEKAHIGLLFIATIGVTGLFFLDVQLFIKRLNNSLKAMLTERKLKDQFPHFYTGSTFDSVVENTDALFTLLKSFDSMKASRIVLEMNSIKLLINNIRAGVLLVDKDKVVTHVNHTSETMLGLIPSEIIGQTISRKISNEVFLEHVNKAMEFDQKVIDQHFSIKEGKEYKLNIFPVKDKFGEVVRALVILTDQEPELKETETT